MSRGPTIVLASGGTGGHLFPAEALAHALLQRGYRVALLTDARGTAFSERVPEVEIHKIDVSRTDGGFASKALAAGSMAVALAQTLRHLQALAPVAAVGFGGYPSVPTIAAAGMMGIPVILHEQNALLGRANRLLAPAATAIASCFASIERIGNRDRKKLVHTGNPVRPDFAALAGSAYQPPQGEEPIRLLVTGGSQGATVFADIMPDAVSRLPEALRRRLRITQQCRAEDLARVTERYREIGVEAETAAFFSDVPARLDACHLAICRAGASTIAELTTVGRPSVLVPYPHATDDHQSANAWALESVGGAVMIKQLAFTADYLATRLEAILGDAARLSQMAKAAHTAGKPDAAGYLANLVGNVLEGRALEIAA